MSSPIVRAILLSACFGVLLGCSSGGGDDNNAPPNLNDPLYGSQWHLKNTGQNGGTVGEDANVEPVWNGGRKGEGVRIVVVDDGLEIGHEDLSANVVGGASYNYLIGNYGDPTGGAHGTAVAGVAAARDMNGVGVRGVAPRASLLGYNLLALGSSQTAADDADAMIRDRVVNSVSNNSWGAPDGFGTLDASAATWRSAIDTGLSEGRGGRGLIYTWAAGNGAPTDNSNYDGQANYRGVMAICAVGDDSFKASYSEPGANLWVCAPSSNSFQGITTTDRSGANGYNVNGSPDYSNNNYTGFFGGTSSATPVVSGVVALMLQANPNLGWRDVRLILAETARKNHPAQADWTTNGATPAYNINHNYGFGVVDANAAVARALTWTNVAAPAAPVSASQTVNVAIPDNTGVAVPSTITIASSGISNIEFVEVTFVSNHTSAGNLEIVLSRSGAITTVSRLAETRTCGGCGNAYASPGWRFGSARHLGEPADGDWILTVRDNTTGNTGTFQSWTLTIYGR